jgi:NADH:ubiquinone oxidoreductase subunit E
MALLMEQMNEDLNPRMIQQTNEENIRYIEIVVCMGSSCFSRGNKRLVPIIESFFQTLSQSENQILKPKLLLKGSMCENLCKSGPNVKINGIRYSLKEPEDIIPILKNILFENGGD